MLRSCSGAWKIEIVLATALANGCGAYGNAMSTHIAIQQACECRFGYGPYTSSVAHSCSPSATVVLCGLHFKGCSGGSISIQGDHTAHAEASSSSTVQLHHMHFSGHEGISSAESDEGDVSVLRSSLTACSCNFDGSSAGSSFSSIYVEDSHVRVHNSQFRGSPTAVQGSGSGAIVTQGESTLNVISTSFSNYTIAAKAVVLLRSGASFNCLGCAWQHIRGNPAVMATVPAVFNLTSSRFYDCFALGFGGAVHLDYSGGKDATAAYMNCVNFTNCRASDEGGAVIVRRSGGAEASLKLKDSLFQNCTVRRRRFPFSVNQVVFYCLSD